MTGGGGGGRSTAIVLFTDLVGSTELRVRLGEDGAEELRRRHDRLMADAIDANRGLLVKKLGDGVMATFAGASDAVAAAVAIQQAVDRQSRSSPAPLEVRIGISAGDVVFKEQDCFGTPVIEAARLCGAARGGQILVSEVVRLLAGTGRGQEFPPVGSLDLKGLPAPVSAYEVAWEPLPVSPLPLPALLTDIGRIFVGRHEELERLEQLWKEAAAGERRAAFLAGEPGVGKTRLAAELASRVHEQGATVLAGRCDEDLGVPYQPFVEALHQFLDHTPGAELRQRLGRYAGELTRLVPELAAQVPDLPPPLRSDPETERYRLFDAVAAWLAAVSETGTVLLVVDDLQWAARPTLLLLRHLLHWPEPARLLLLGAYRDTELGHDHPLVEVLADLRRQPGVERLSLSGLDRAGVTAFMEQAGDRVLTEQDLALAGAIYEETEGNPFFVREVFRHLTETGDIHRHEGRWTTRLPVEELGIPEGVRDVVGRRLARLSEETNRALRVAAVAGTEFDVNVMQAAAGLDEEPLLSVLEEAVGARLVIEAPGPPSRHRFAHALVRDTLYDGLTAARRAALHRRVAEAIETVHAGRLDDHLPALAAHYARAATPAPDALKAVHYARRAGDRALAQLAHDEALSYYAQALEILEAAETAVESSVRLDVLTSLGEAQRRAGVHAYRETLLDAARGAAAGGDVDRLVRAVLANNRGFTSVMGDVDEARIELIEKALELLGPGPSGERAELLGLLAAELAFGDDHERRLAVADEAAAIAARVDDVAVQGKVGLWRLLGCLVPDRVEALVTEGAEVVKLADASGDPQLRALARGWWVGPLSQAGLLREAREATTEAVAIADETGEPALRSVVQTLHAGNLDALGEHDEATRLAQAAFDLGQEAGHPDALNWYAGRMFLHWTYEGQLETAAAVAAQGFVQYPRIVAWQGAWVLDLALAGQDEELADVYARLPDILSTVHVDMFWIVTHFYFAVASGLRVPDKEAAALLYDRLLPYRSLHATYILGYLGPVETALGVLARVLGNADEAIAHHETAAAAIEESGAARARALNGYLWALALRDRGDAGGRERARQLLEETLDYSRAQGYITFEQKAREALTAKAT